MKKLYCIIAVVSLLASCSKDSKSDGRDYAGDMREFVAGISGYAKGLEPGFIIIPQNGVPLVTENEEGDGEPAAEYLAAIDGIGQEDLFYGYDNDDEATPADEREYLIDYLDIAKANGKSILVIDYCTTLAKIDDSYSQNDAKGYISFAAQSRDLNMVATYPAVPYNVNNDNVAALADAKNFLYIINPENYTTKSGFLTALAATDYDIILIDLFFNDEELTAPDIASLKTKNGGGTRLVIAYMSIGEAEDYRYYWQSSWDDDPPSWLDEENPDWEGNYKVKYWKSDWQDIIYGNDSSYLKKIIDAGFDGVYLDIIDAYEYFDD